MSESKKFVDGLIVKDAPVDFIVAKLSFKVDEIKKFLDENNNGGWVNADILISKNGKMYAALNEWKPDSEKKQSNRFDASQEMDEADIPF